MELFAVGAESDRRSAETSLREGKPLDAREHAHKLLARAPKSPLGLALLADAAEAMWLDEEAEFALRELSTLLPWRADIWLRLGRVLASTNPIESAAAFERAAGSVEDPDSRRAAAFELCDRALAEAEPARALAWLERVAVRLETKDEALLIRRAECLFALGQAETAAKLVENLGTELGVLSRTPEQEAERLCGRRVYLFARLLWALSDMSDPLKRAQAVMQAKRAYILEVPGASDLLANIIASSKDASELRAFSELLTVSGERERFEVSIALAEGRAGDVREALLTRTRAGDAAALTALLGLAIQLRDREALAACVAAGGPAARLPAAPLFAALDAITEGEVERAVNLLAEVSSDAELGGWAEELLTRAFSLWTRGDEPAWSRMAAWLLEEARQTGDLEAQRALDAMQLDNGKPLLVAVLGEFNAGKSTFINAFVGADVAPTGILPTTATVHRLAFAPDPFARILIRKAPDRTIPHERLRETLRALEQEHALIDGVQIYAPIERLKWTEILDTPGFNSSNEEHDASARRALREAHAVIWLADATSPLKATEAAVLDEVRQAGLPVLLLVNKIDRLPAGTLDTVLEHLKEASQLGGAEGSRLRLLSGPHPFSARQALRGRLGNAEELASSRWSEVEEAITRELIDSGDDLREAAHRRRLSKLIEVMATRAETEESKLLAERASTIERARRLRSISSECELHRQSLAEELRRGVASEWQLFAEDCKPLGALSKEAADEFAVRSYLAERLTLHLAGPAIRWLTHRFDSGAAPAALPLARASLTGVALASPSAPLGASEADAERLLACVVRSFATALDLLGQELLAKGDPWRRSRRLRAFGQAIAGGERTGAKEVKADANTNANPGAQ